MSNFILSLAEWWGRQVARYGIWIVGRSRLSVENAPAGARFIAVDWHGCNLIAIAVINLHLGWNAYTFTPPGVTGTAARGWHLQSGLNTVPLPEDGMGNPVTAMKRMVQALDSGGTPVISVDGPHGPARKVRPGALWLARFSGAPIVPAGMAARPALNFPRWDRQLIPLPGAHVAVVFGRPMNIARTQEIDQPALEGLGQTLNELTRQAQSIVHS